MEKHTSSHITDNSEIARRDLPKLMRSREFMRWFGRSKVVSPLGEPLLVYRGEHGRPFAGERFQSRHGALSFGSHEIALTYATSPNHRADCVIAPRVLPAILRIENPFPCTDDDPFVEFDYLITHLGSARAEAIALSLASHMEQLGQWLDDDGLFQHFKGVADLIQREPTRLRECYVDAYRVFDSIEYCRWLAAAGFDGVIHGGNGASAGDIEYKVFDHTNVYASSSWLSHAHSPASRAVKSR